MTANLTDLPLKVISLAQTDIPETYTPDEPGTTYEAHAAIKAILYGHKSGCLTIADDSGLEVDALDGWPGVVSATWLPGNDEDRLMGLLHKMKHVPDGQRTARYRSVIAIFDPVTDKIRFAEGTTEGRILMEAKGDNMFGYNRIFFSDDLRESFGTAPFEDQVRVSHRTRSLQKAREILLSEFV